MRGPVNGGQKGRVSEDVLCFCPHDAGIGLEGQVIGDSRRITFDFESTGQGVDVIIERHLSLAAGRFQPLQ